MAITKRNALDSSESGEIPQSEGENEKHGQIDSNNISRQLNRPEKPEREGDKAPRDVDGQETKQGPQGGFDSTPIPRPLTGTVGYTVRIKFHRAFNLAIGDAHALSSDPYVLAQLNTSSPTRHKEDPKLRFRTQTVRKDTEPEWNEEWIVANVPSSGFKLKIRLYDEDPADHDDILGKVYVTVPSLSDDWPGIINQPYRVRVRDSSMRAILIRAFATCFRMVEHFQGELYLSIDLLGRTQEDGQGGRLYTVGPCRWTQHYSPLLGRIANVKEPDQDEQDQASEPNCPVQKRIEHYNFQANQIQLQGPVPTQMYHRFVEFKPWVRRMFTTKGVSGIVLGKALHHQHKRVYNFGRSTEWGYFPQGACVEMTKQFLDLVHYDKGGRIFTYVLTLDALFRFTETGKEFGIDMLSKHTMHSDVSIYIAFSGEFFIRRRKHRQRSRSPNSRAKPSEQTQEERQNNNAHPSEDINDESREEGQPTDPSDYELVIDNDSGTYRPNASLLPVLASFLYKSLPGLQIQTLDCQADAEKMSKMKAEQGERKKKEGDHIIYTQGSDSSSISSTEDEALDEVQAAYQSGGQREQQAPAGDGAGRESGTLEQVTKDAVAYERGRMDKMQRFVGGKDREENIVASRRGGAQEGKLEGGVKSWP